MIFFYSRSALKELYNKGSTKKIDQKLQRKALIILDFLDKAQEPDDMDIVGFNFHELTGNRKSNYTVKVNKNWRITYFWDNGAIIVNLEDYH